MTKTIKNFLFYWIFLFILFHIITFITPVAISGVSVIKLLYIVSLISSGASLGNDLLNIVYVLDELGIRDVVFYKYGGAFWTGYAFIVLTLVLQLVITIYYLDSKSKEKTTVGGPLVYLFFIITPIMMTISSICMIIPDMPNWLAVIICMVILFVQVVLMLIVKSAQETEYSGNEAIMEKTSKYRSVVKNAETLLTIYKDNKEIKKIVEDLKYSDSTSETLLDEINEALNALKKKENIEENTELIKSLLVERKSN